MAHRAAWPLAVIVLRGEADLSFTKKLFLSVLTLLAVDGAPANTLEESVTKRRWERSELWVNRWFYGPSLGNPRRRAPKAQGDAAIPMALTTQLTLAVPLFGRVQAAATPAFTLQPFEGSALQLQNPSFGLQTDIVESKGGPFSYWARYEVVTPVTESSRAAGQRLVPQAVNVVTYQPSGSGWIFRLVAVPSVTFSEGGDCAMNA